MQDKLVVKKSLHSSNKYSILVKVNNDVYDRFSGYLTIKNKQSDKVAYLPIYFSEKKINAPVEDREPRFDIPEYRGSSSSSTGGGWSFFKSVGFYGCIVYFLYNYGNKVLNDISNFVKNTYENLT